jgi:hypothetical protein
MGVIFHPTYLCYYIKVEKARSSDGRAPPLQGGGRRFESARAYIKKEVLPWRRTLRSGTGQ